MNLLYIQLLYFSHAFYAVANGACPNGWFSHGLSCYFYSKTSVDFADAMVFCKNIDAALVEIESDDENKFIQNSLKNITLKVPPHGYWIGLTDIEIENEWKWIESGNSASYVNWNPGQPDLRQSENCGILWYSTGFTWHDDFCSDNLAFFICEKEAGKPPPGLHLDVVKENKMVQKLMIDTKKCYFFGRNKQMCDFCIDHQSCSRVHAALVWHKHLSRPFILDLGSTHGTFIGRIRLESKKPQQVPIDSEIHFGASTRLYIIRERPQPISGQMNDDKDKRGEDLEGSLLGLPETETELDNLTEFNTAHNRRIASMKEDGPAPNPLKRKHKNAHVFFYDEEDIINPEDIDPSVGRFRNLVSTTVIPTKRQKLDGNLLSSSGSMTDNITKRLQSFSYSNPNLYGDLPSSDTTASIASKMGIHLPNLAPDIEEEPTTLPVIDANQQVVFQVEEGSKEPRKKKYAKEAWPGKKPTHSFLV